MPTVCGRIKTNKLAINIGAVNWRHVIVIPHNGACGGYVRFRLELFSHQAYARLALETTIYNQETATYIHSIFRLIIRVHINHTPRSPYSNYLEGIFPTQHLKSSNFMGFRFALRMWMRKGRARKKYVRLELLRAASPATGRSLVLKMMCNSI